METVSAGTQRVQSHDLPFTAGGGLSSRQCRGFGVRKEVRIKEAVARTANMCRMPTVCQMLCYARPLQRFLGDGTIAMSFMDGKTEAQGKEVTCLWSHSWEVAQS